jgi:hypothetical protein
MLLDRHRVAKLIELADLERRASDPERLIREEDVALLIKAAYDDASDAARAEFLARVKLMPSSAWPWSAVQAMTPRGRGGGVVYSPAPGALAPAALVLLRGQVDSADADSGNRIPDRGQPGDTAWEPLHKALDLWDTATIKKWIAPQGWMSASGTTPGPVPNGGGVAPPGNGGTPKGGDTMPNGNGSGTTPNGGGQPGPQPSPVPPFSWWHPAVLVAGASTLATVGFTFYLLRQGRRLPAPIPAPAMTTPAAATATPPPATATFSPFTTSATPARTTQPSAKETP